MEECADSQFDRLVELVKDRILSDDERLQIMNFPKVIRVIFVYRVICEMLREQKATVTCKVNEPFKESGSVQVEGRTITFYNPDLFIEVEKMSDNFDCYPLTDGKVRLTFTFHGLTVPL